VPWSAWLRLAAGVLLVVPVVAASAQPAGKVYRMGLLSGGSSTAPSPISDGLRQGLRELGWVDGRNIVIEYRYAEYAYERLPGLAAELIRLKVDVIVAPATAATAAARKSTGTIPIVMVGAGNPIEDGFIASLSRPGGNVTGVTYSGAGKEIYAK